jgi:hypothetical protein
MPWHGYTLRRAGSGRIGSCDAGTVRMTWQAVVVCGAD